MGSGLHRTVKRFVSWKNRGGTNRGRRRRGRDQDVVFGIVKRALKGFGKNISPHMLSGAILKINFPSEVEVFDKEIFGLDVFRTFRG
jgi:hypothetical protein